MENENDPQFTRKLLIESTRTMKVLAFLFANIFLVLCQEQKAVPLTDQVVPGQAPLIRKPIDEATWCLIGTVATLPPKPLKCLNQYEIFACAYGEARCDGFGYCGTPPCTWRCWCKNGYKRDINGNCVKFCSYYENPDFPAITE